MLAGQLLQSRGSPTRAAIEFGDDEVWTYEELDGLANRFARFFTERGLAVGDRVSLVVGNDPLLVGAYFGAFRAGVIANPINTKLTAKELAYVIGHAGSRMVLVSADLCGTLGDALPLLDTAPQVVVLRPSQAVPFAAASSSDVLSLDASPLTSGGPSGGDGALLIYTSGTTGNPKGVLLTHDNVVAGVHIVYKAYEVQPGEKTLCVMPLFHTNGLMFSTLTFLFGGGTVALQAKFSATRFWQQCAQHQVSSSSASPTILQMLLAHEAGAPAYGQTGLRYLKVASAPTPVDLAERFEARFGSGLLLETYGLTETTAMTTMNPLHGRRRFGSIGRVLPPQELGILNDAGQPTPPGEVGEICVQGPTVMKGYFRDPESTRAAFIGDWFHTGDMATQDEDGFVTIVGRKKEMIIRGGENISPLEIENVAMLHPKVKEAVAVGLSDPLWGEVVGLCVVAKEPVTREELMGFCRERLSDFKLPHHIVFTDELPRNAMGKVVRKLAARKFALASAEAASPSVKIPLHGAAAV